VILVTKKSKQQCWTRLANWYLEFRHSEIQNGSLNQSGQLNSEAQQHRTLWY